MENILVIKEVFFIDLNFELECRMFRYRLIFLDVGGGGDCFFKFVLY